MKIQNAFRLGLFGGLGVIVALGIGSAIGSLATIITYIGAALFLALGLDPMVTWLEKHGFRRWLAVVTVIGGVLAVFAGLILAIIPLIVQQVQNAVKAIPDLVSGVIDGTVIGDIQQAMPWLGSEEEIEAQVTSWVRDLDLASIGGGVLAAGIGVVTAITGAAIILILTLYFVTSLGSIKRSLYQLVPASKREKFIDLSEQVSTSVGRYVIGQGSLAVVNGLLSFIMLSLVFPLFGLPVSYAALLAFIAFLGSLIPLVGTLTSSIIITLSVLIFDGSPSVIAVGIYYLVYMQIEAYVLNPRIMNQAVKVPGVVVIVAALAGGTLLGILGALVAIPVAAAILLVIKQVVVPRQNEL